MFKSHYKELEQKDLRMATKKKIVKKVELTPAQKAWVTMRKRYTPEEISERAQKAGMLAAATRKRNQKALAKSAKKR